MNTEIQEVQLNTYPAYKDSGVEWLGVIPEHWEVKRLASFGKFSKGGGFSKADLVATGVSAIIYGDIYTQYDIFINKEIRFITEETARKSIKLDKHDLLFTGSGETKEDIGKCVVFLNDNVAYAGGDVIVFKQDENDSLYLSYFLNTEGARYEKARFSKGEIIVHTYASKLREMFVTIPSVFEQTVIANFLDDRCSKIDAAVEIKQQQIALLKERRQIAIHQAVTQGLDKNVPMKDSAVEWIGEIPEHWEVKKMKFVFEKIQTGTTPPTLNQGYYDGDIDWYNPKDLNDEILNKADKTITNAAIRKNEAKIFYDDSILIVGIGATTGKTSYLVKSSSFNQQITGLKTFKYNNKFYFWFLKNISNVMLKIANYTTLPILNNEFFKALYLTLPPLSEQQAIVAHLEELTTKIDSAISLYQQEIEKLKEYKATLINSAVTGKIKIY